MTGSKVGNFVPSQYILSLECQAAWNLFKSSKSSGDPSTVLGTKCSMIKAGDPEIIREQRGHTGAGHNDSNLFLGSFWGGIRSYELTFPIQQHYAFFKTADKSQKANGLFELGTLKKLQKLFIWCFKFLMRAFIRKNTIWLGQNWWECLGL